MPITVDITKRTFVVVGHRARTDADFDLGDLCGAAGRLDILCRCVGAAFTRSHGLRTDTELLLQLLGPPTPPKTLRLVGRDLRRFNPDERSTAARLRDALAEPTFGPEVTVGSGVTVAAHPFDRVIDRVIEEHDAVYVLDESGRDLRAITAAWQRPAPDAPTATPPTTVAFVLGDDRDLTAEETAVLTERGVAPIALGPVSLHANQCIVLVHNELDRCGVKSVNSEQ